MGQPAVAVWRDCNFAIVVCIDWKFALFLCSCSAENESDVADYADKLVDDN